MIVITEEWIRANGRLGQGWTKAQLKLLGVVWPPKRGWLQAIIGRPITTRAARAFERRHQLANQPKSPGDEFPLALKRKVINRRAEHMRVHLTPAEAAFAQLLVARRIWFRSQQTFVDTRAAYITDFRLSTGRGPLIVEIDGPIHAGQTAYDNRRTRFLTTEHRVRLIRFSNDRVLTDGDRVIMTILQFRPRKTGKLFDTTIGCYRKKYLYERRHRPDGAVVSEGRV